MDLLICKYCLKRVALDVERFTIISFVNDVFIYCSGKVDVTGFPLLILCTATVDL